MSDKNRIRIRPVAAPRGILFDRNGLPLVDNRPAFTLSLIPARAGGPRHGRSARLAVLLKIPLAELQEAVDRCRPTRIRPVRVRRGLSLEDVTKVEERKLELPGVIVEVEPQRVYPTSTLRRPPARLRPRGERRADEAGPLPARRHDRADRASSGCSTSTCAAATAASASRWTPWAGRCRSCSARSPTRAPRSSPRSTGASRRRPSARWPGTPGAVVVMDPRNGDVLAMTSSPAFPLDRFTGTIDRDEWLRLVRIPMTPLMNRALAEPVRARARSSRSSWRRPACRKARSRRWTGRTATASSTWAAGPSRTGRRAGTATWTCARPSIQSCNVFFYQAGLKVGRRGDRALRARVRARARRPASTWAARSPGSSRRAGPARGRQAPRLAGRRHREHVDRPGRAAGDADAGRADDGGRRQRRRPLEAAPGPARRARRTARSRTRRRAR